MKSLVANTIVIFENIVIKSFVYFSRLMIFGKKDVWQRFEMRLCALHSIMLAINWHKENEKIFYGSVFRIPSNI